MSEVERHTRCARCRDETGRSVEHPLLCDSCALDVVPADLTSAAAEFYANSYAHGHFDRLREELANRRRS
jgi:hypothetical protein